VCIGRRRSLAAMASVLAVCTACSETTRYRVMSFFLDGVPPPGSRITPTDPGTKTPPEGEAVGSGQPAPPVRLFAHTPYRENRCQGCHDADSGQLTRTVRDGLCRTCHSKLVATAFVHGPAAVSDCTVCHHHHAAPFQKLLLVDATATCLNCHERDDLSTGEHHTGIHRRACTDCHDPHGGTNRFFVKGVGP